MNDIKRLLPRHHQIIKLALAGHQYSEIARHLGITSKSVQMVLNSPIARDELARRRKSIEDAENMEIAANTTKSIRSMFKEKQEELAGGVLETALMDATDHNSRRLAFDAQKYAIDKLLGDEQDRKASKPVILNVDSVEKLQIALTEAYGGTDESDD